MIADGIAAFDALTASGSCVLLDAADAEIATDTELGVTLCDDGPVPSGGGSNGIPVPVKYAADSAGNDWTGLPPPALQPEVDAADAESDLQPESGNRITLDVDVTLPTRPAPKGGRPLVVFMHGCCGGSRRSWEATSIDTAREHWHHSNVWFAARGYVVVNYTARGFRNANDEGSTGSTQLDSRRFEINDYQHIVGLIVDHDAKRRFEGEKPIFDVNPKKVAAVGGSYGGGFTWLAFTDPKWKSPGGIAIKLAAAVTKYGWTDLVEALIPSGHYLDRDPATGESVVATTDIAKAPSRTPFGVLKQSIVSGLYASGNLASADHTTFPAWLGEAFTRLQMGGPYDGDAQLEPLADAFLADRSAYYQTDFWNSVGKPKGRVPVFAAATWTDPLFPPMETIRFYNKLKASDPKYPIKVYFGDYQHFVANKAKEWGDLCGDDRHVCTADDFRNTNGKLVRLNRAASRVRQGVNSRINKFLDHYLLGKGKKPPPSDVSATTTICAANATDLLAADEPGIEYRAPTWRELAPKLKPFSWGGGGVATTTTASTAADTHAADADPVARDRQTDKCYTTDQVNPGAGIVRVESEPLKGPLTMLGLPAVKFAMDASGDNYWIAVRMFDLDESGSQTMVTRGVCKANLAAAEGDCSSFELFGNGWLFDTGHRIALEITQADIPFLRLENTPTTIAFSSIELKVPVANEDLIVDPRFP